DLDLGYHVLGRNDASPGRVATFLGVFLIFKLNGGGTGLDIAFHAVGHIEQSPVAGVPVADDGSGRCAAKCTDPVDHVAIGGQPRVGKAQVGGDRSKPSHVEALKSDLIRYFQ